MARHFQELHSVDLLGRATSSREFEHIELCNFGAWTKALSEPEMRHRALDSQAANSLSCEDRNGIMQYSCDC